MPTKNINAEKIQGNLSITSVSATTYYNLPTSTFQQVYTASTEPRITTDGTLGPLRVRNGSGSDTNLNFAVENNTGDVTGYWKGNGDLFVNNLTSSSSIINGNLTVTGNTNISGSTTVGGDVLALGYLRSYNSSGDEGGEIFLNKAQTNTTLSGGVTIDVYQNKIRFFEQGGDARGAFIDLTACIGGAGTNLLSGGGGEINTASNLGSGTGLFAQKSSADLQFKSLTSTGGTVTISNNSTTVNLEVVPASNFTGGTVTGATSFTNGLSATTISATTYLGIPTSLTGGTYSNGSLLFTNNTGGTVTINTSTTYAAGVISGSTYTSTGTGQVNLPAIKVALYDNANNIEPILVYDVASGTTGTGGIPALVDQDTNYILVEYNGGTPRYYVYDNDGLVDDSSAVLFMVVYRTGNFVHTLEFGNQGAGLANKLNDRFIMTDRFGYESGLALSLSADTGIVMCSAGVAWNGPNRQSLTAVNSSGDTFFKNYHSGGIWTYTTTGKTVNNTYYDDGTDIVAATAGKYLTNWYFIGQETNGHLYEVFSPNQYDSVALAQLSLEPSLPELITSHAFLVGRIIVGVGATTGLTEGAFVNTFQSTNVTSHNDLVGIQGGTAGQYYHLTSNQYNNLALTNTNNYFSVGQTINGNLSANTFTITSTPVNTNDNTQILTRNSVTGDIEYVDVSVLTGSTAPSSFNYGLVNAMINFNFLT